LTPPPRLVCIPRRDAALAATAREIAARIPAQLSPAAALDWFGGEIRRAYPTAAVRAQSELARGAPSEVIWYVTLRDLRFRIDQQVQVPLPPRRAFEVYVGRVAEWQTAVTLTPVRLTPELVGTEYEAAYSFMGMTYRGTFRILASDPPRSITLEASGSGIAVSYTTTFEAHGSGTLVHVQGDYALPESLIARAADRLGLERAITRDIERANETYRRLCESIAG
jgi:hypothetical protein